MSKDPEHWKSLEQDDDKLKGVSGWNCGATPDTTVRLQVRDAHRGEISQTINGSAVNLRGTGGPLEGKPKPCALGGVQQKIRRKDVSTLEVNKVNCN